MKIVCDTTFLDGRDRFEAGDAVTVQPTDTETSEQRAQRFISNGWAHAIGDTPAAAAAVGGPTELVINSVQHGQEASHG